ncbi:MAG: hypothetical protein ABR999_10780 [Methanoregula sp.]|jgi:hypothetical protein
MTKGLQIIFIVGTTFFPRGDMINIRGQHLTGAMHLVRIYTVRMFLEMIIPGLLPRRSVSALRWRRSFGIDLPLQLYSSLCLVFVAQSTPMT